MQHQSIENMQQYMNKAFAKDYMNAYGAKREPFFFMIDFMQEHCLVERFSDIDPQSISFDFEGVGNFHEMGEKMELPSTISFQKDPLDYQSYLQGFQKIQKALLRGDSYLVNYTASTPIKTNLCLKSIFDHAQAKYKLWVKDQFVSFSPETFIKINDGKLSTFPMKGTIDAHIPNAKQKILENKKEMAEHATIVDLLRNDLSISSSKVRVHRFRYIDELQTNNKHLLQVSSEISGKLQNDFHKSIGDLIFEMLPAGSISGAPKTKTVNIILDAENHQRGYYTGVAGFFDGNNMNSCVIIRYIEQTDCGLIYKSGGGITAQSNPLEEYQELIDKVYVPIY